MRNKALHFIHSQLSRWTRRFLLGGAAAATIMAMVALADNGVPTMQPGSNLFTWADEPARYCQALILGLDDDANLLADDWVDPWIAPDEPDSPFLPKTGTFCQVSGRCTNNQVGVDFRFEWCCELGKGCYIKSGGMWVSLANWIQLGGAGCVVQVGCR
jgi:hypothetical protein